MGVRQGIDEAASAKVARRSGRGFSLLEPLVALCVICVAMLAMLQQIAVCVETRARVDAAFRRVLSQWNQSQDLRSLGGRGGEIESLPGNGPVLRRYSVNAPDGKGRDWEVLEVWPKSAVSH